MSFFTRRTVGVLVGLLAASGAACGEGGSAAGGGGGAGGGTGGGGGVIDPDAGITGDSCTLVYDLPAADGTAPSALRISAAFSTQNIGPGRLVVRVPATAAGAPESGVAELLYFDIDQFFGPVFGVTTQTRVCLLEEGATPPTFDPAAAPAEQADVAECIDANNTVAMATGSFTLNGDATGSLSFVCYDPPPTSSSYTPDMATGTAPGCMQTWFGYGHVSCTGGTCSAGGLPSDGTPVDKTGTWSQHFLSPIALSADLATLTMGNVAGGGTASAWAHVPNNDTGWTGIALQGVLNTTDSTCDTSAL